LLGESSLLAGTINSSFMSLSTGEVLRGYGLFPHPNVLAGFAVAISLLAMRIYRKRDYRFWIIIVTSILITVLTFSRIHIVLLLVSLSIMATFQFKKHLFSFFPFLIERFQTLTFGSSSVQERLSLFKESLEIIKTNWIFGVGSGEFSRYLSSDIKTVSNISLFQPVHNIFLLLISEYGILGVLTFIPYLLYILISSNKGILFISISIFCIIGIGMFDHYLLSLPQGLLLLFLMLL
jgi:O-antigen ligase